MKRKIFKEKLKPLTRPQLNVSVISKYYYESSETPLPTSLSLNIPVNIPTVLNYYQLTGDWRVAERLAASPKLKESMISIGSDSGSEHSGDFSGTYGVPSLNTNSFSSCSKSTGDLEKPPILTAPPKIKEEIRKDSDDDSEYCSEFSGQATTPRDRCRKYTFS